MKPLLLNRTDIEGGAARAAYRLHTGLKLSGIDSRMLVALKHSDDTTVIGPETKLEKGMSILSPVLDTILLGLYRNRERIIFSPAIVPENMAKKVALHDPDLIHLNWINEGFLRIETLRKLRTPIVWTLHDMWAFTGGCHYDNFCGRYQESCGRCPLLNSNKNHDISYWILKRKRKAWRDLNITLVTPSHWLAECARSSALFNNKKVVVIPYGLDIQRYKTMNKRVARAMLSMPHDKKIILFGALNSTSDKRKGFQFLIHALQMLDNMRWQNKIEIIIFGSSQPHDAPEFGYKTHYVGHLKDEISLALLYAAADVFIAPSIQENLSNTVMEALSCGTPCVAFHIGGMPEMVVHEKNGYLAQPFDPEDLAHGIAWIIEDQKRWNVLSQQARQKVVKEFNIESIVQKYLELYNEVLRKSSNSNS